MQLLRPEYPRPQLRREKWLNLNGVWNFDFDDDNVGIKAQWQNTAPLKQNINVPFAFQSALSGINIKEMHDLVWYQRDFEIPADWEGQRVILHFGAVDYRSWVWVNGCFVTFNEGGHTPFHADITPYLNDGINSLVLRVEDLSKDLFQPRGKQYWEEESASIFYTRTTGIWQTVWLEPVPEVHLKQVWLTPDIDSLTLKAEYELGGAFAEGQVTLETEIRYQGESVLTVTHQADAAKVSQSYDLSESLHLWSPESPALYDLTVRVISRDGAVQDQVESYFGMRKISVENGKICLNNQPYVMKLVLDQGYHPEGLLTFPTDEAYKQDIELTKAMGFNGARKHQKVEDPRYLYWADQLGLLVWGEMANAYDFSPTYVQRITAEWQVAMQRDYNHPCIVVWVPMNESWGVPALEQDSHQREHLTALYHLTRSLDSTRLVVSNDGWEHTHTDILSIHDYESKGEILRERYATIDSTVVARPAKRALFVGDYAYAGQPVLLTEYGGVAFRKNEQEGWGYSTATNDEEFATNLREIMQAVYASPVLQGYCYTQLTDVEQEINGLLTYDRQPKIDLALIAAINDGQ
jgi:beta-galactosidase/beta-glucuronidase